MSFLGDQVNLLRQQEWLSGRTKALVCSRSLVGIAGSNQAGVWMRLLSVLCVVRLRSLRRADHSSGGVLPCVVCLNEIVKPRQ